jgi:hypothetical protein
MSIREQDNAWFCANTLAWRERRHAAESSGEGGVSRRSAHARQCIGVANDHPLSRPGRGRQRYLHRAIRPDKRETAASLRDPEGWRPERPVKGRGYRPRPWRRRWAGTVCRPCPRGTLRLAELTTSALPAALGGGGLAPVGLLSPVVPPPWPWPRAAPQPWDRPGSYPARPAPATTLGDPTQDSTTSGLRLVKKASTSACSWAGTPKWSSVAAAWRMNAAQSWSSMCIPACEVCMSRPV